MSERLTKRDENGNAYYDWGCLNRNHWALGRHVDRLAAYEDTGLTPEQIRELQNAFNILFESEKQKQQEIEKLKAVLADWQYNTKCDADHIAALTTDKDELVKVLKQARESLQAAWEDDGSTTVGKQILETINAIDALTVFEASQLISKRKEEK